MQGLLELLDVPYVGAGVMASAVAMDKVVFKDLMAAHGVPQVDYAAVRDGQQVDLDAARPAGVRQAGAARLVGRHLPRHRRRTSVRRRSEAFAHDALVIVEALAGGLEVECSVLGDDDA